MLKHIASPSTALLNKLKLTIKKATPITLTPPAPRPLTPNLLIRLARRIQVIIQNRLATSPLTTFPTQTSRRGPRRNTSRKRRSRSRRPRNLKRNTRSHQKNTGHISSNPSMRHRNRSRATSSRRRSLRPPASPNSPENRKWPHKKPTRLQEHAINKYIIY